MYTFRFIQAILLLLLLDNSFALSRIVEDMSFSEICVFSIGFGYF
jgi:hypothetical protein